MLVHFVIILMALNSSNIIRLHVDSENPKGLYLYELPKMPAERDIWYYDTLKKDQYWKTPHWKNKWLDQNGRIRPVRTMTEKERIEYIDYWRDKWENGLWIMVNGEPTWLTGTHIEHLVFNQFKGQHFIYTDAQRERFYFRDLTNRERLCDGRLWAKGRRVGITAEEITEAVRVINSDYSNNVACKSDIYEKAKSTLLSKIIEVHIKRPEWMREYYYSSNGKVPRSSLELTSAKIITNDSYPLGGIANAFPSTVKAIDGLEFMLVILDEISKIEDVSPREMYEVDVKTIVNPGKRGKIDCLSTTGDSKEVQKAVKDWHQLIADSNPKVLNANGKTNSGMWYWFVSYIHSFELWEKKPEIMDRYGKVNREMAEEYIWTEVNKFPRDSKPYIFALYKMPTMMRHVLLTATNQGYFSKVRIAAKLEQLRALPNDRKPYVVGALEYDKKGDVYFESNAERATRCEEEGVPYEPGYWMISVHPYFSADKGIDTRNRYRKTMNGFLMPPINPEGCIGYDSIRYRKEDTVSTHLSEAAIIVYQKHDYFDSGNQNKFCGLYLHRPDDPRDANRECIKAAKYWGYPVNHERVIETTKEDFITAKMLAFLLINPKDGLHGMIIDSGGKVVKNALDAMVTRFSPPKTDEDEDMIATMPFEPVLVDLDGFDIGNTTAFNVFMAMVQLEHGLKQVNFTNMTDKSDIAKWEAMKEAFPSRNQ
mgnify:CR=1 FL=1